MLALGGATLIAACGGSGSEERNPVATDLRLEAVEDLPLDGQVSSDARTTPSYAIVTGPSHGQVTLGATTGKFRYVPAPDYFGPDTFSYVAQSSARTSKPAMVSINVAGVNDPPTLDAIPDLQNSPDQLEIPYTLNATDVDGDSLSYSVNAADTSIATVEFDEASHTLRITPLKRGETSIDVEVRDAKTSARRSFKFTIGDVTKSATTALASNDASNAASDEADAVALTNNSTRDVAFTLTHNGFPLFRSDMDMVEYVRAMKPMFEAEPFERKLWRFVRNNVYHWPPLSDALWHNDPWVTLTSLGWGFCSNVSATYVRVARAAGYEARVWGLTGHVVPEIKIAGRWQMFDPDLAVYYRNSHGEIAGVEELVQNPSLISAPIDPVLDKAANPHPYSEVVADIYASSADNFIGDAIFLPEAPPARSTITLPAGAQLTYPGMWTEPPVSSDGITDYEVPSFLQGKLALPNGWTGAISIPWMVADIQGTGRVRIGEEEVEIGSEELEAALRSNQSLTGQIAIVESRSPIYIIMFMNALRYQARSLNEVAISGVDVWAIELKSRLLSPEHRVAGPGAEVFRKPRTIAN